MFLFKHNIIHRKLKLCLEKLGLTTNKNSAKPSIYLNDKRILAKKFDSHNEQLSQWLGRELPWPSMLSK